MGLQKATYSGVGKIMDAYDAINKGNYFYSVWHGERDIAFQCTDNDAAKARQYLEENLLAMEQSDNDHLLYLKFHPSNVKGLTNGFIDRKTTVVSMCPVRAVALSEGGIVSGTGNEPGMSFKMYEAIKVIQELPQQINEIIDLKMQSMDERLLAIENGEDDEPELEPVEKYIGLINGVMSNPQLSPIIGAVLAKLFPDLTAKQPIMHNQINGVKDTEPTAETEVNNEMLNNALVRLNQYCNLDTDLTLLADLAETNPAQFNMMLGMLRSSK